MPKPTLLVFTLGDARESRRRRLLPNAWRALEQRLHRACLDNALEAGRKAGFRLEISAPSSLDVASDVVLRHQRGRTFGERLRHAFDQARQSGPVVLVGSDIPGLRPELLEETHQLLAENPSRVVVGPSPDGGFYLLASRVRLDGVLGEVRWRTRNTMASLAKALRRRGHELVLLPSLADLDRRSDLERWLASIARGTARAWHQLLTQLVTLLRNLRRSSSPHVVPVSGHRAKATALVRGPPSRLARL